MELPWLLSSDLIVLGWFIVLCRQRSHPHVTCQVALSVTEVPLCSLWD